MREIKFQYTWRDRDDKFHTLTEGIEEIEEYADIPSNRKMGWVLVARRQYTGLHDKNGKEIYEGDIVTLSIQGIPQIPLETIIWNNTQGGFALFFQEVDPYFRVDLDSIEVIGNIYENLKDEHPR